MTKEKTRTTRKKFEVKNTGCESNDRQKIKRKITRHVDKLKKLGWLVKIDNEFYGDNFLKYEAIIYFNLIK